MNLTRDDINTLLSAMRTRQAILNKSNDYPEKKQDKKLINKLLGIKRFLESPEVYSQIR